jgi:hypothetical protein
MRKAIGSTVIGLLLGMTAFSDIASGQAWSLPAPTSPPPPPDFSLRSLPPSPLPHTRVWIHLNGVADLERLRANNFNHYLRAQSILAAANQICQPGPARPILARFDGDYLSCGGTWFTSNPPKKLLTFHLDDVGYIALVSVTVDGGKMQQLATEAKATK